MPSNPLTNRPSGKLWVLVAQTTSFGIFLPLFGSVFFYLFSPQWKWPSEPFHSLIETLGGGIAISVAGLLLFLNNTQYGRRHHFWVGCGLISMGLFDIFHAGVPIGNTFVWFHSVATFLGGFFLGLIWLDNRKWLPENFKFSFLFLFGIVVLGASVFLVYPDLAPKMLHDGVFTFTARSLNILGGIGFLAASAWLVREVSLRGEWDDYFLLIHCLLFGSAGILFEFSELWDGPWWWWHFLRLLAYAAVFGFALKNYQEILDELKNFNDQLNVQIKKRTKRLEETTLQNQLILQSVGEGIFGLNLEGNITFANPAAENMLGYTFEEMSDETQHSLIHHTKSDGAPYPVEECEIYMCFKDGLTHRNAGDVFWRKDGTSFPVEFVSTPILENGVIVGAVVTFMDISERMKNENLLKQYSIELENNNKELSSFASITSHDLKNPIRKIANYCVFIEEEENELSSNSKNFLSKIELTATHANNLIDGILKYSQLGQGRITFELVDLNKVLVKIIEFLEIELLETKGKVEFEKLPRVLGDEFQIKQLFENLISNSLKYRQKDVPPIIKILCDETNQDHIHIILEDNGIGFDNIYAAKIFDPFQRLDGDVNTLGSGLGLSICRKIMLRHFGRIVAEGEVGKGAKFTITFPRT